MPLLTSDRLNSDVVPTSPASSHRGRVWKSPIRPEAAHRGRVWKSPMRPEAAHRGRVWKSPVQPNAMVEVFEDLDVVSPWPAARRGRVWRSPLRPGATWSRRGAAVALIVALIIAAGGGFVAQLDDFDATPVSAPIDVFEPAAVAPHEAVSLRAVAEQVGATELWAQGVTGVGVNVAVIDTGSALVPALHDAVVAAVDVSDEFADPARRFVDGYGHGTHLAGIVAGRDASTGFTGIAPGAGIVSVKVAGRDGSVRPENVIAGIDWVTAHADELGIRVINLALDTGDTSDYRTSELAAAVERAWAAGIVVVTAAGNDGPETAGLNVPASDPFVIAVGGVTEGADGLVAAEWASRGNEARRPDLAAPGAHLMSLRAPGSVADVDHPEGFVDDELFLGSGSSQSAAVVAGIVALVLQVRPELTPDDVKAILIASADPIAADASIVGAGVVRADRAAVSDAASVAQTWTFASTDAVSSVPGVAAVALVGSSWTGNSWTGNSWTGNSWTGNSWTGNSWTGNSWTGNSWTGNSWTGNSWTGNSWTGNSWTGNSWTGNSWTGNSWTGNSWTGNSWTGNSWTGNSWTGNSWTGNSWTGNSWTGNSWTGNSWTGNSWTGNSWTGNSWTGNSWTGNSWT